MIKTGTSKIRLLLAILILTSCIGCDQATKGIARAVLKDAAPKSLLADTIRLDLMHNPGGFLSLGSQLPDGIRKVAFVALNVSLMIALSGFLWFKRNLPLALFISLVFILAGGIGNLIDRLRNEGLVTDFLNIGIGRIRTGVFNVADMILMVGIITVGWLSFRRKGDEEHE